MDHPRDLSFDECARRVGLRPGRLRREIRAGGIRLTYWPDAVAPADFLGTSASDDTVGLTWQSDRAAPAPHPPRDEADQHGEEEVGRAAEDTDVAVVSRVLEVSRSGYYEGNSRAPSVPASVSARNESSEAHARRAATSLYMIPASGLSAAGAMKECIVLP